MAMPSGTKVSHVVLALLAPAGSSRATRLGHFMRVIKAQEVAIAVVVVIAAVKGHL